MKFFKPNSSLIIEIKQLTRPIQQLDEIDALASTIDDNVSKEVEIPKDVLNSFKIKDSLEKNIWPDEKINPRVKNKLIKIAKDFIKDIELPENVKINDIIFTGSLANYNWSKFSDIDLHVVIDYNQFDVDPKIIEDLFYAQKSIWNQEHDITVFGYPVEIYVQNLNDKLISNSIYSLLNDKWVKKAKRKEFSIDKKAIKDGAEKYINYLKDIRQDYKDNEFKTVVDKVTKIKNKIKNMRKAGLESGGEYSNENLIFKVLRRTPFMDILDSFKAKSYDKLMSVSEKMNIEEGEILDGTKFKSKKTEDGYELIATYEGDEIGSLVMDETTNGYWIFDGDLTQDEYDKLFPDDKFMQITHLSVPDKVMRGEGIAKKLMTLAINKTKKLGYDIMYLNASPMGSDGLPLPALIKFYESFGFKVFKHQGNNALMIKNF